MRTLLSALRLSKDKKASNEEGMRGDAPELRHSVTFWYHNRNKVVIYVMRVTFILFLQM